MTKIPQASEASATRKQTIGQRISQIMTMLQQLPRERATPELFLEIIGWVQTLPAEQRPDVLVSTIAQAFDKTIEEMDIILKPVNRRVEFDSLVPKEGWIQDYVNWTRNTEPPTVFHFFVAATVIGAALGRNVYFDKGAYMVFPNLCVVIVAPTGRCRKTSACNIGTSLYAKIGGTLLADKATPEAMCEALKTQANATGLIYAPELAVFLGKQKYQEGMVPLLTALFDCPKEWTSKTIGRGETTLTNVALSSLMCSTIDWLQTGIPRDAFGGGFMSRFLFVVQENTSRVFPLPPALDAERRKDLISRLAKFKNLKGPMVFTDVAREWYIAWYKTRPSMQGEKQYAGYYERKPDHLIRIAIILVVSRGDGKMELTDVDLMQAEKILHWMEIWLPSTFEEMTASASGEDQTRILRQLKMHGGSMEHSTLLRRNSSKMNAESFKRAIGTLREAKLLEWDAVTRTYTLTPDGWK